MYDSVKSFFKTYETLAVIRTLYEKCSCHDICTCDQIHLLKELETSSFIDEKLTRIPLHSSKPGINVISVSRA